MRWLVYAELSVQTVRVASLSGGYELVAPRVFPVRLLDDALCLEILRTAN
jgi:hypothetical protein